MNEIYRLIGYKDILGRNGPADTRNDVLIGPRCRSEEEAIKEAKRILRKGEYFHVIIVKYIAEYRGESYLNVKITKWS